MTSQYKEVEIAGTVADRVERFIDGSTGEFTLAQISDEVNAHRAQVRHIVNSALARGELKARKDKDGHTHIYSKASQS